jgi:hypothetical protein
LSHSTSPIYCVGYFWDTDLENIWLGWFQTVIYLISAYWAGRVMLPPAPGPTLCSYYLISARSTWDPRIPDTHSNTILTKFMTSLILAWCLFYTQIRISVCMPLKFTICQYPVLTSFWNILWIL